MSRIVRVVSFKSFRLLFIATTSQVSVSSSINRFRLIFPINFGKTLGLSSDQNLRGLLLIFGILLFLCFTACKDPIEGCTDVEATNYDVSADKSCEDCCTYPQLSLEVAHRYDTLSFSYDSIYNLFGSNQSQFLKVIFYLSDFRLVNATESLETIETIDLNIVNSGVENFKDDFTLVSRSISGINYDVGEIRGSGTFDTLKFSVGLAGNAALGDAETVSNGHPLAIGSDTLWTYPDGYICNQIIIVPDTTNPDTIQFDLKATTHLVEISLPFSKEVNSGFDVIIPLKIDYKEWFLGIDFAGDTADNIVQKIVLNTSNVFSIND